MHDIRFIRDNPDAFDRGLARRGLEPQARRLTSIDERRRAIIRVNEGAQARRNAASKEIAQAKANKDGDAVQKLMAEVAELKISILKMDAEQKAVEKELNDALAEIPNLPLDDVPDGKDANDNVEHHRFGAKREYAFAPKQHFDLGEALGQMDFETAAKLSGARFVVLKKGLARLERALGQFMLDVHTSEPHSYTEVSPPLLVNDDAMIGTAQLPKFKNDQFSSISLNLFEKENVQQISNTASANAVVNFVRSNYPSKIDTEWLNHLFHAQNLAAEPTEDFWKALLKIDFRPRGKRMREFLSDYGNWFADVANRKTEQNRRWLIPTAEVPLTNLVRESILDEPQLPMRYTACTPCFRAEAGAAGKDTRGMIRQHQFTKVELVSITTPEQSKDEHERMLSCAEEILRRLGLHYRVMALCAGDMGFASQKTYDIEVWLPGQNMYREISSCSVCGEFQARRMNARYRTREGRQVRHVHTLNGSGVAVGRALIAVMETYQQEDGSIAVPDALVSYMGGMKTIEKQ
jgi:seryl-tRNA synthetase